MPTAPTPFLWFDTQAEEAMNFYVVDLPAVESRRRHPRPGTSD
jgi:predicted 3-demethylubiquinone-9 3-methyltransferase (glyoxalase superfamily)